MQLNQLQVQKYNHYQIALLVNLSLLCWLVLILTPSFFTINIQLIALISTVTIIGIPHGYFDFLVAKKLFSSSQNWLLKFITVYLSISLIYFYAWISVPLFSLILFLLMATYHFGEEESNNLDKKSIILLLTLGSIPIVTPIMFHSHEVFSLFSVLLNSELSQIQVSQVQKVIYTVIVLSIIYLKARKIFLLYILLLINFILLPPLLSFILYFCFHHSLRHYLDALCNSDLFERSIPIARYAIFFLFLTVAFTSICLLIMSGYTNITFESAIIKYIFITLACLTLPHLALNIIYVYKQAPST